MHRTGGMDRLETVQQRIEDLVKLALAERSFRAHHRGERGSLAPRGHPVGGALVANEVDRRQHIVVGEAGEHLRLAAEALALIIEEIVALVVRLDILAGAARDPARQELRDGHRQAVAGPVRGIVERIAVIRGRAANLVAAKGEAHGQGRAFGFAHRADDRRSAINPA
ncbi:MAG: hypothetical protein P8Z76_10950 [Alphaproteobacteria bacterium]